MTAGLIVAGPPKEWGSAGENYPYPPPKDGFSLPVLPHTAPFFRGANSNSHWADSSTIRRLFNQPEASPLLPLSQLEYFHFTIVLVELIPNCCHVLTKRLADLWFLEHKTAISTSPTVKIVFFFPNQKWHGYSSLPQTRVPKLVSRRAFMTHSKLSGVDGENTRLATQGAQQ